MTCNGPVTIVKTTRPLEIERALRNVVVSPDAPTTVITPSPRDLVVEKPVVREVDVVEPGRQGPPGEPGQDGTGDKHYPHIQAIPSATWVVVHGLNKYPAVTVVDSSGQQVTGDVTYDSLDQVTLTFVGAFSGKAYFN